MSWLCDSTELISGGWHTSAYAGHGILAEDIPSTGVHGASVLYDQVSLPGDAGKEVRGEIVTPPSGLTTWWQDEDGAVDATAPDGSYPYTVQVYVDGAALGSPVTVTLTFGAAATTSALSATCPDGTLSASTSVAVDSAAALVGPDGTLSAASASAAQSAAAITCPAGTLSAATSVAVGSAAALVCPAGTLSASSTVAASGITSSLAATCPAGTLSAATSVAVGSAAALVCPAGTLAATSVVAGTFIAAATHCLARPQAERTVVPMPAELRNAQPPTETLTVSPRA